MHLRPLGHLSRRASTDIDVELSRSFRPLLSRRDRLSPPSLVQLSLGISTPSNPTVQSLLSQGSRSSAEREGFEPSVPVRAHLISNQVPSTARTSLRGGIWQVGLDVSIAS